MQSDYFKGVPYVYGRLYIRRQGLTYCPDVMSPLGGKELFCHVCSVTSWYIWNGKNGLSADTFVLCWPIMSSYIALLLSENMTLRLLSCWQTLYTRYSRRHVSVDSILWFSEMPVRCFKGAVRSACSPYILSKHSIRRICSYVMHMVAIYLTLNGVPLRSI